MSATRPILVSGSHRSGTTWVGKMIASSPAVGYIHEPFNPLHRPGICTAKFPQWFKYVSNENEEPYYEPLQRTLAFRFNPVAEIEAIRSAKHVARMGKNWYSFTLNRLRHATPLMKDPIAIFSCDWLAQRFDMNVIVMIRHPAAFASSLRRLHWEHNFNNFVQQPLLLEEHLQPFIDDIEKYARHPQDILDQAILLWRMMHHMILKYQQAHKDWIFLRHEDISADPMHHYTYLFKRLNLDFTEKVKKTIEDYSNPSNPSEAQKGHVLTKRDSKANIKSWRKKLTEAEITHIRSNVEDISSAFYTDSDW
ncbi:MAG TPA: sulfotransferase [Ktedonobacteraceae bacterium]|nr:sulfotransferase [Ktedonobacteraceae bacterium]